MAEEVYRIKHFRESLKSNFSQKRSEYHDWNCLLRNPLLAYWHLGLMAAACPYNWEVWSQPWCYLHVVGERCSLCIVYETCQILQELCVGCNFKELLFCSTYGLIPFWCTLPWFSHWTTGFQSRLRAKTRETSPLGDTSQFCPDISTVVEAIVPPKTAVICCLS